MRIAALCLAVTCAGCGRPDGRDPEGERPPSPPLTGDVPQREPHPPLPAPTPLGPLTLIRRLPHAGWSEGLDVHGRELWHSFPGSIKVYDKETGDELRELASSPSTYNESLAWRDGELWNVSYDDSNVYVGRPAAEGELDWHIAGTTPEVHGWGITHDPDHVIVTGNGSPFLYFLDPQTAGLVKTVTTPVDDLEDLAWDRGAIWASSYSEYPGQFFRIDPSTGAIVDVHSLPGAGECSIVDGIAVDGTSLYVTGKHCPWVYVFEMP